MTFHTLGDLIAAAYRSAHLITSDRRTAGQLAARTVGRYLARKDNSRLARRIAFGRR